MKRVAGLTLLVCVATLLSAQTNPNLMTVLATDRTYNKPIGFGLYKQYNPHRLSFFVSPVYAKMFSTPAPEGIGNSNLSTLNIAYGAEYALFFSRVFGLSIGVSSGYENRAEYSFGPSYQQEQQVTINQGSYYLKQRAVNLIENYSVRHLNIPLTARFMGRSSRVFAIEFYVGAEYNLNIGERVFATGMIDRRLYNQAQTTVVPDGGAIQVHQGVYGGNGVFANRSQSKYFADGFSALAGLNFHFRVSPLISLFFGGEAHMGFTNMLNGSGDWAVASGYSGLLATNAVERALPFYYGGRVGFSFLMGRNRAATRSAYAKEAYEESRERRREFLNDSLNVVDRERVFDRRVSEAIQQYELEAGRKNAERNHYLTAVLALQKDSMAQAIRSEIAQQMAMQKDTVYVLPPTPKDPELQRYRVVVASTRDLKSAEAVRLRLEKEGYSALIDRSTKHFRVVPFSSENEREAIDKLLEIKRKYAPRYDDVWLLDIEK